MNRSLDIAAKLDKSSITSNEEMIEETIGNLRIYDGTQRISIL
jgi:hypothetical protein